MSFYTSLTGLNAATAQLGVTSNNIANVSTVGFKRSRTDFGDIFATSPLQKASATVGQGVSLKRVTQEFGQGNMMFSSNTLDMAISGDGFFPLKSQDGLQDMFTRNGAFLMNDQYNVVNSAGQRLMAAKVDSSGKADLGDLNILTIPQKTSKMAKQTSKIQLGLNFPADANVITKTFDRNDAATYNKSTALTIYDEGGNSYLATIFYAKTQNASSTTPTNKWQTYVYVGDTLVGSALQQATNSAGDVMFVNKYGQLKAKADFKTSEDVAALNSSFSKKTLKFSLDELTDVRTSVPATVAGGTALNLGTGANDGVDFSKFVTLNKTDLLKAQASSFINYSTAVPPLAPGDSYEVKLLDGTTIPVTGKTPTSVPFNKDIVEQLNVNKVFAAKYIATTSTQVTLAGVGALITSTLIPLAPVTNDVDKMTITIDGVPQTINTIRPMAPHLLADVAQHIQDRLRVIDHGSNSFKVTAVGGALVITDDKSRTLTNITLTPTVNPGNAITAPAATVNPVTITAIDHTTLSAVIAADIKFRPVLAANAAQAAFVGAGTDGVRNAAVSLTASSVDDLKNLFSITLDNSNQSVSVGLDYLAGKAQKLSGSQLATELTHVINRAYGDEKAFNFSSILGTTFTMQLSSSIPTFKPNPLNISLEKTGDMTYEDLVRNVQTQIDLNPDYRQPAVVASYDTNLQQLVLKTSGSNKVRISAIPMGIKDDLIQGVNDESLKLRMVPDASASALLTPATDQRYGATVEFDPVKNCFVFKSGKTGDQSSIRISKIKPNSLATQGSKGLGLINDESTYAQDVSKVEALRGITSTPAILLGKPMSVNVENNFGVDVTNNQFVVSVNGITGTVIVPPKDAYTLDTFIEQLQAGINAIQGESKEGLSAETVDGVKVSYDRASNALKFTSGTASTSSYIKVEGSSRWGLNGLDAQFGQTTTWIKPGQFKNPDGGPVYIDGFGKESTNASGFDTLPSWSPVYFDKGELTFDTGGNLISPKLGAQLETVYLPSGKGKLNMTVDYSKSSQFATPYAVLSQAQDGAPEGDLVGLAIADDGLVKASYSNGAQISLAKIVLVNFSNPAGLRQIGDTTYFKTSDSGAPKYGEAGSAGFGTVRSGATERANVDLTQELVDLITEQRNFQANAKAMETSTSMTQTIIQIRA
ncbi:MAG: flagellar hook-basal body complex protein [Burkholderiaceae bacterium]